MSGCSAHASAALTIGQHLNDLRIAMADLGAWLSLAQSTPSGGEYIAITDAMGGPATMQTDTDRRPAAATAANGIPVATWDGTDVLRWTLSAGTNTTTVWGLAHWFKPADFAALQNIYVATGGSLSGGLDANRLRTRIIATTGAPSLDVFAVGNNGRSYTSTASLTAAAWNHVRWQINYGASGSEFDDDGTKSTAKIRCFIGGAAVALTGSDIGTGGTPSAINSASGFALIGGPNDSDTPVQPIRNGGQTGDFLVYTAVPSAYSAALLAAITRPT